MEEKFLKLLKLNRQPAKPSDFGQLVIGPQHLSWGFAQKHQANTSNTDEVLSDNVSHDVLTEKNIVLDSLQRFTQKVKERGIDKMPVPGGEVVIKPSDQTGLQMMALNSEITPESYLQRHQAVYGEAITQVRLNRFLNKNQFPKVYFLVDKIAQNALYQAPHPGFEDLRYFFSEETSVLFSKMIQAMKLSSLDYVIGPINFSQAEAFDYRFELALLRPQLVMTLGATSTHDLLNIQERLNNIHGKFFSRKILSSLQPHEFLVMPLFNPEFLRINPSMKKTAWEDMQKVMKQIGN
jgi:hypothetical protein